MEPVLLQSLDELNQKTRDLEDGGMRVIDCNDLEHGLVGKLAFFAPPDNEVEWAESDARAVWFVWPRFGKSLTPEIIHAKASRELSKFYMQHTRHRISGFTNSVERSAGFVCYCKQAEGKSLVCSVKLPDLKDLDPELVRIISL